MSSKGAKVVSLPNVSGEPKTGGIGELLDEGLRASITTLSTKQLIREGNKGVKVLDKAAIRQLVAQLTQQAIRNRLKKMEPLLENHINKEVDSKVAAHAAAMKAEKDQLMARILELEGKIGDGGVIQADKTDNVQLISPNYASVPKGQSPSAVRSAGLSMVGLAEGEVEEVGLDEAMTDLQEEAAAVVQDQVRLMGERSDFQRKNARLVAEIRRLNRLLHRARRRSEGDGAGFGTFMPEGKEVEQESVEDPLEAYMKRIEGKVGNILERLAQGPVRTRRGGGAGGRPATWTAPDKKKSSVLATLAMQNIKLQKEVMKLGAA